MIDSCSRAWLLSCPFLLSHPSTTNIANTTNTDNMAISLILPCILAAAVCPWVVTGQQQPFFAPNLFFNWTTSVVDPVNVWYDARPDEDGNRTSPYRQWNVTFDGSPWANYEPGMVGTGVPSRTCGPAAGLAINVTLENSDPTTQNASVSAQAPSSAWYIRGTWNTETINSDGFWILDNSHIGKDVAGPREAEIRADAWGYHEYMFSAREGDYTIDSIIYTLGMRTDA